MKPAIIARVSAVPTRKDLSVIRDDDLAAGDQEPGGPELSGAPASGGPRRRRGALRVEGRGVSCDHLPVDLAECRADPDELVDVAAARGLARSAAARRPARRTSSRAVVPSTSRTWSPRWSRTQPASPPSTSRKRGTPASRRSRHRPGGDPAPRASTTRRSQSRSTRSSWWLEKSTGTPDAACSRSRSAIASTASRVEAGERLVEDQRGRLGQQGGDDLDPLLVAQRELLQVVLGAVAQAEPLEQRRDLARAPRCVHALEPAEVDELVEDLLLGVEPALLGHVAEPAAVGRGDRRGRASSTSPASEPSTPMTIRMVVVLPAPLPPTKPVSCPGGTSKDTWSTAVHVAEAPGQLP